MRSIRSVLRELLLLDEPPERTARTYGMGVFLGVSPLLGFRTFIAIAILFLAKVNRLALLAGVYSNSPWTVAPVAALGTVLGFWVLGVETQMPEITRRTIASGELWEAVLGDIWNLFVPFFVGNWILAAVAGLAGYLVAKRLIVRYHSSRSPAPATHATGE